MLVTLIPSTIAITHIMTCWTVPFLRFYMTSMRWAVPSVMSVFRQLSSAFSAMKRDYRNELCYGMYRLPIHRTNHVMVYFQVRVRVL